MIIFLLYAQIGPSIYHLSLARSYAIESAMLQEASEIFRFPYVFLRSLGTCLNEEQSALLRDQVIFPELNSSYAALPFASGSTLLSIL